MEIDTVTTTGVTERHIEDCLWETPKDLNDEYMVVEKWIARQLKLPSGILDLLGFIRIFNGYPGVLVVELKNGPITSSALGQVMRYSADISKVLEEIELKHGPMGNFHVYRLVIGSSVSTETLQEANSMDVMVRTFKAFIYLECSGVSWTDEYQNTYREEIEGLVDLKTFDPVVEYAKAQMISLEKSPDDYDIVDEFEEAILNAVKDSEDG